MYHDDSYRVYASTLNDETACIKLYKLWILYLHLGCSSFEAEGATVNIAPSGLLEQSPGQDLTLNCTAVQVGYLAGKPYWWVERHGTLEFCKEPHYVQQAYYDESTCTWISSLSIQDFSATLAGNYFCHFGNHLHNRTIYAKGTVHYYVNDHTLSINNAWIHPTEHILVLVAKFVFASHNAHTSFLFFFRTRIGQRLEWF